MVDLSNVASQPSVRQPPSDPAAYRTGRAVERAAVVTAGKHAPETLREMQRLAEFLASGRDVRRDVPPGFYFNAQV